MPDKPSTIFLVGDMNVESTSTRHACATRATAEKRYHEVRKELIIAAQQIIARRHELERSDGGWPAYKALLESDDEEAYHDECWDTPYIREMELEP